MDGPLGVYPIEAVTLLYDLLARDGPVHEPHDHGVRPTLDLRHGLDLLVRTVHGHRHPTLRGEPMLSLLRHLQQRNRLLLLGALATGERQHCRCAKK
jgi:hypothetical protein